LFIDAGSTGAVPGKTLMLSRKLIAGVGLAAFTVVAASQAMADTTWQRHHPRREQVNDRLANQNHRIKVARKDGDLSASQARALHAKDRAIRAQERADASADGGHITRAEQRQLNHEENHVSATIPR
jgi:hypothetical protein